MSNDWTPGPWRAVHDWIMAGGVLVASIPRARHGDWSPNNALLIAAAPELYEALEAMLERYTGLVNCGDCGNWDPEKEAPVIAARTALVKARGE